MNRFLLFSSLTTTLLLIAIVVTLNLAAIWIRARLRRPFVLASLVLRNSSLS